MNRNFVKDLDFRYKRQQGIIKEICIDLDLVAFYPEYHADKTDNNTVIIYTKENHKYNEALSKWASEEDYKNYVCCLQNTDVNGYFSLSFMNRGKIDLRGLNEEEQIRGYIENALSKYNSENN